MMFRRVRVLRDYRLILTVVTAVFYTGCADITGGRTLEASTRGLEGAQYQPQEVLRMLESLGYQWLPVHDPDSGHPVRVAEIDDQYRMLLQSRTVPSVRVEVHIRVNGNTLGLHLYETGNRELSDRGKQLYRELRQRLVLEYGADNITENHPLLTP